MHCANHPGVIATHVPWWSYTHFLDVDCGLCSECVAGDCQGMEVVEIDSEEYWEHERDMREGDWRDGVWVS